MVMCSPTECFSADHKKDAENKFDANITSLKVSQLALQLPHVYPQRRQRPFEVTRSRFTSSVLSKSASLRRRCRHNAQKEAERNAGIQAAADDTHHQADIRDPL